MCCMHNEVAATLSPGTSYQQWGSTVTPGRIQGDTKCTFHTAVDPSGSRSILQARKQFDSPPLGALHLQLHSPLWRPHLPYAQHRTFAGGYVLGSEGRPGGFQNSYAVLPASLGMRIA